MREMIAQMKHLHKKADDSVSYSREAACHRRVEDVSAMDTSVLCLP